MAASRTQLCRGVVWVALVSLLGGCIPSLHWKHPHPLQDSAVGLRAVSGRTLTLTDGRSFDLAGISFEGMTASQIAEFEQALATMVAHRKSHYPPGMLAQYDSEPPVPFPSEACLVPFPTSNGSAVVLVISKTYHRRLMSRSLPLGFPFAPLIIHDYPMAFDLSFSMLFHGYAMAEPKDLPPNISIAEPLPKIASYTQPMAPQYSNLVLDARRRNVGIHYTDERAMKLAASHNDLFTVDALLAKGVDVNAVSDNETAMIAVSLRGTAKMMAWLLRHGADPNLVVNKRSAMSVALGSYEPDKLELLLKHGADPKAVVAGQSLLSIAANGNASYAKLLLEDGARPADAEEAALLMLKQAQVLDAKGLRMLLELGYDPSRATSDGRLPLHAAAASHGEGQMEVINLLLDHGADPDRVEPATGLNASGHLRRRPKRENTDALLRLLEKPSQPDGSPR